MRQVLYGVSTLMVSLSTLVGAYRFHTGRKTKNNKESKPLGITFFFLGVLLAMLSGALFFGGILANFVL